VLVLEAVDRYLAKLRNQRTDTNESSLLGSNRGSFTKTLVNQFEDEDDDEDEDEL
jgi:hypothetical protein